MKSIGEIKENSKQEKKNQRWQQDKPEGVTEMKIFRVDTAIQWIRFESNGQEHIIAFKRNWWRGFTYFAYDGEEKIKILETCPAFLGKLKYIISNILIPELKRACTKRNS